MSVDTSAIAGGTNKSPMIKAKIIVDTGTKRAMPSVVKKDPKTNMNFEVLSLQKIHAYRRKYSLKRQ